MPSKTGAPAPADLRARLAELLLRDERRLRRRLDRARSTRDPDTRRAALERVAADIATAQEVVARRRASVPAITYPPELPVSEAREDILAAIRDHQIVVLAGETGSGKTTQLPKLCLELGRGVRGQIGHTQPRRLAARSVAARIAEELAVDLGDQVGFQVRFTDRSSDRTLVKVMTDGILLAEIQRDPLLRAYDTLIIDEAHERSLNIDFLLGYLQQLLPRRPDLKLIITSATIDLERFAGHFTGAKVVEVSGRTYPVEVRYRPLEDDSGEERDQVQGICDAVEELCAEGPGDVLVFCSGEREIRDAADGLRGLGLRDTEVLPLYARLSAAEQHRIFAPHRGRRVVVSTNVAETSLTVPGIRYVVDPGTARISRYSSRTKVQRLPIEKISRASADQRKGRCGRVAEGICIRLYSEEDFEARPPYTDPEILRTNLAAVILQMAALGLGDVAAFPFVDPPEHRSVRDAVQALHELGAVDRDEPHPELGLTEVGRVLAKLPVDPRLGRMLVEAGRTGALREVLVIAAALSIQDVRERPADQRQVADEHHARFADETSDFLALLRLWDHLQEQQRQLSSSAFRRRCKAEFLHHLRVREWQDLHAQLRQVAKEAGMTRNRAPAEPDVVHRALLAGLLSHIGLRTTESRDFNGARGTRFAIWPGSALARKPPSWVMAAELVETSRLWARMVARIEPEWAEQLAPHLVKRSYGEPHWSARRGAALAVERVTLYGVPLVTDRKVPYGRIDPGIARELFLRHALVEGEWRTHHRFLARNRQLLAEVGELEHRARRRDIGPDEDALYAFYDARVPEHVVSTRHFDRWWKTARQEQPELLTLTREQLLGGRAPGDDLHPDVWIQGDLALRLTYRFEPGAPDDGVTVHIPLAVLNRVSPAGFDWQVPGLREELVTALLRGLPKPLRRALGPVPELAAAVLERLDPGPAPPREPFVDALARELHRLSGVLVPREAWLPGRVPDHLRMTFRVVDGDRFVDADKDLGALRIRLVDATRRVVALATGPLERRGATGWDFGTLPQRAEGKRDGHTVVGFPALVDEGAAVGVRVWLDERQQQAAMWQGTRRLLRLAIPPPVKAVASRLDNAAKLALTRNPHGSVSALIEDCTACALDALLVRLGGPVWDAGGFARLRDAVRGALVDEVLAIVGDVRQVLGAVQDVEPLVRATPGGALQHGIDDARGHLRGLVHPGFVAGTGRARLPHLVRYVRGIEHRLRKLPQDPARDRMLAERVHAVEAERRALARSLGPGVAVREQAELRWLVEELRISLFAQHLGTPVPVSEQRIFRAIADLAVAGRGRESMAGGPAA